MQTTPRLMRSRDDKMIAGVASGIARYLSVDPVIVRLVFVLLAFSGMSLLFYPLFWLIMPEDPSGAVPGGQVFVAEGTPTQRIRINPSTSMPDEEIPIRNADTSQSTAGDPASRQRLLGVVLLGIGVFVVLKLLIPGVGSLLLPALLVIGGIWLLKRSS
jgi:phage shock protein C